MWWCLAARHRTAPALARAFGAQLYRAKKVKNDKARAAQFAKLAARIAQAARAARGDESDLRLASAVSRARQLLVPKATIDAAIAKAAGADALGEEVRYEGARGQVAVVVEALTDKRTRTAPELRTIFSRHGGALGADGAAAWQFARRGFVDVVPAGGAASAGADDLFEIAVDCGADDVDEEGDGGVRVVVEDARRVQEVAEQLRSRIGDGFALGEIGLAWMPTQPVELEDEDEAAAVGALLDALEDHPDVQGVYHNVAGRGG